MPYRYNPHRHVKIWLSKNRDLFLNLENQLRLVRMRDLNKTDEIHFIYDSALLSATTLQKLNNFCEKHRIIAVDIQTEVIPECKTAEEKKLIALYQDEVRHLEAGGNLGVASDILRWVSPVYKRGTYSDLDVAVDTRGLPETIIVDKPLLLRLGSLVLQKEYEAVALNNDTVAVVDSQEALPYVRKIQTLIYKNCSKAQETENLY